MQEKRKAPRKSLVFFCKVHDATNGQLVGRVADLTEHGLMILAEQSVEVGQSQKLNIIFPYEFNGRTQMMFDGSCAHCNRDVNPDYWDLGYSIHQMPAEDREMLKLLIERLAIEQEMDSEFT